MVSTTVIQTAGTAELTAFANSMPSTLIYTSMAYINLVAKETGSVPYWIVASDASDIRGALPLLVKQGALGSVVNSLAYYGSNGGIIAAEKDEEARLTLLDAYTGFCNDIGACASTIITNPLLDDADFYRKNLPYDLLDQRIGQFTFFPEDRQVETLLSSFSNPRPRNIRKAMRANVEVSVSQALNAVEFLHDVHEKNINAIGGLPKRLEFFKRLMNELPEESWKIYLAEFEGERIAALLLLYHNGTVEYFTPCVLEEHRSLQALPLLIFSAMSNAMFAGYRIWNWGGTWLSQDGVYAFKKKWCTRDMPYFYFTRLYTEEVRIATREELLAEYPGFFVLPFAALSPQAKNLELT